MTNALPVRGDQLMIYDFKEMTNNTVIKTDLCIIGAGAAGISIAQYFIGKRFQVCVVESGGFEFDAATQSLYEGKNIGLNYYPLDATRLRYFGGSSNHWGGWCAPLREIDFEQRDWVPYSGWPINQHDLEVYYIQAQKLCEIGPYRYRVDDWEKGRFKRLDVLEDKLINLLWQHSPSQTKFGKRFHQELEQANNVQVLLHANVLEIISKDNGLAVEGVKISRLDATKTATVQAKVVVLAGGGLENPRILLTSNRVQSTGLGNQNDNVGRFFMEHAHVGIGELVTSRSSQALAYYKDHSVREGIHLQPILGISEIAQQKHKMVNVSILMHSHGRREQTEAYRAFQHISQALKSGIFSDNFPDDLVEKIAKLTNNKAASGLYDLPPLPHNTHLTFRTLSEQVPNPESRVSLDTETDVLGLPKIQLNWRLTELEKRSISIATQLVSEELERLNLGQLQRFEWLLSENEAFEGVVGGHHHMGTTRMSENPKQGVVDKNCRVHGLANLYIAGSSVFATSGCSNPTLTLVALAVRLAEHLETQVLR